MFFEEDGGVDELGQDDWAVLKLLLRILEVCIFYFKQ